LQSPESIQIFYCHLHLSLIGIVIGKLGGVLLIKRNVVLYCFKRVAFQ